MATKTKPKHLVSEQYSKYYNMLQQMRLIDDTLMTEVFSDKECAQVLIRTILNRNDINVLEVRTQDVIHNFGGHSVRLDIRIEDADGKLYDVEIQRSNEGASPKRARHNSAALGAMALPKGSSYQELPETYVIFITESDVFRKGLALYHVERVIAETGEPFDDGEHIIYVNSTVQNDTPLGMLMKDFWCCTPDEMTNQILRTRTAYFKSNEKGVVHMCEIMEKLAIESEEKGKREIVQAMHKNGMSAEAIAKATSLALETVKHLLTMNTILTK